MKIKITRNTVVGGTAVNVGAVIDLPEQEAKYLMQIGKAEKFVDEKVAETAPTPEADDIESTEESTVPEADDIETADLKPTQETTARTPRGKRKE